MKNTEIEGVKFGLATLIIRGKKNEAKEYNLNTLTVQRGNRQYKLDVIESYSNYFEDHNSTGFIMVLKPDEEVFDDCPYNMTKEDFLSDDITFEMYISGNFENEIIDATMLVYIDGVEKEFKVELFIWKLSC